MADYSAQLAKVKRKLQQKGMPMMYVSLTEDTTGKIDPETGSYPVKVERIPFFGVKTNPTAQEVQAGKFQDVSWVVLMAGDAVPEVDTTDVLQFGGHDWDIVEMPSVEPAEQRILYKLGVRDAGKIGTSERMAKAGGAV